jgi:hypothetical protein
MFQIPFTELSAERTRVIIIFPSIGRKYNNKSAIATGGEADYQCWLQKHLKTLLKKKCINALALFLFPLFYRLAENISKPF